MFNNQINQDIIRFATNNPKFQLSVRNDPMPLTFQQGQTQSTVAGFLSSSILSVAIAFIPASIIVFIVKEAMIKSKHQQVVSGVSLFSYWLANFVIDQVKYSIFAVASIIILVAFGSSSLSSGT